MSDRIIGQPQYADDLPPSLSDFRRLGEAAYRLETADCGEGTMDAGPTGNVYTPPPDLSLWARLTAAGTGSDAGKYSWKQVQADGTGAIVDAPAGMAGAFDGSTGPPLVELSGATGLTVGATTGRVVRAWLAESGEHYWFRDAAAAAAPSAKYARLCTTSVGQSIPNNTVTAVSWTIELADTSGFHDPANPTLVTNPFNTMFLIEVQLQWASNATGYRAAYLKNSLGNEFCRSVVPAVNGDVTAHGFTAVLFAPSGVYEVTVLQNSGGALSLLDGSTIGTGHDYTHLRCAPLASPA